MSKPNIEVDDVNLEDLILLGEDKKIPIEIEFPNSDGNKIKAKALVKQLTLKQIGNMNMDISQANMLDVSVELLEKALFKMNGENFTREEIEILPLGVINAISDTIMDLSGFNGSDERLRHF